MDQIDRVITISIGANRRSTNWQPSQTLIADFRKRLAAPVRGAESLSEYMMLKKAAQDDLKDIGGFVGGTLNGPRRKACNVTGRDIITLDADNIPAGQTDDIRRRVNGLGIKADVYTTAKHHPAGPRLRILIYPDRTLTADEYEPCARKTATYIDPTLSIFDPTTFEAARLMYFPRCSSDSQYLHESYEGPFISADGILAQYSDWRDVFLWPHFAGEQDRHERGVAKAVKQGDPEGKTGGVGAFCRTYDVYRAMDELLPGIYEPVDNIPDRYTYSGGSTTGGAVVYDNGKFLYSHHATDPCGGRLVNAFDLVRVHRFGDLDDEAQPGTPNNRMPSYLKMMETFMNDKEVAARIDHERYISAVADFTGIDNIPSGAWMASLKRNENGVYDKSAQNVQIMLENDPRFAGKIGLDEFAYQDTVLGELPWDKKYPRPWNDADRANLQIRVENLLKISAPQKIDTAFTVCASAHAFHPIRDYLNTLPNWDAVPRLETLYIDYLGAADTPYVRAVTRKGYVAAVARAMAPGCKFDTMTILYGPQGIGKSSLLRIMAGDVWFNDSIKTLTGKDAMEALRGTWFVEFSELEAFSKAEVAQIKSYLSSVMDRFRVAYGHNIQDFPRQCVFFGTTNKSEVLKDSTGGRRFWVVQTNVSEKTKNVFRDLPGERDQIWAEAVMRWRMGEEIYLTGDLVEQAAAVQETHREADPWEAIIKDFVEKQVPIDWNGWTLDKRRMFWAGGIVDTNVKLRPRDRVCAAEVWCEALNKPHGDIQRRDSVRINDILTTLPAWERVENPAQFSPYGNQRGFKCLSL